MSEAIQKAGMERETFLIQSPEHTKKIKNYTLKSVEVCIYLFAAYRASQIWLINLKSGFHSDAVIVFLLVQRTSWDMWVSLWMHLVLQYPKYLHLSLENTFLIILRLVITRAMCQKSHFAKKRVVRTDKRRKDLSTVEKAFSKMEMCHVS